MARTEFSTPSLPLLDLALRSATVFHQEKANDREDKERVAIGPKRSIAFRGSGRDSRGGTGAGSRTMEVHRAHLRLLSEDQRVVVVSDWHDGQRPGRSQQRS